MYSPVFESTDGVWLWILKYTEVLWTVEDRAGSLNQGVVTATARKIAVVSRKKLLLKDQVLLAALTVAVATLIDLKIQLW